MKHGLIKHFRSFGLELLVYSGLMAGYLFLLLHYFGEDLHQLFLHHRPTYAWVALAAVVAQGFLLEGVTRVLMHFLKPDRGGVE